MRLVSFQTADSAAPRPGAETAAGIVDLAALSALAGVDLGAAQGMKAFLSQGRAGIDRATEVLARHAAALEPGRGLFARDSVRLASPIPDPGMVLSASMTYRAHLEEMGVPVPPEPTAFLKNPGSVIGTDDPIPLPPDHPDMVDYEGEFAVVFGATCHRVDAARALDHVAGFTLINDVSARDWALAAIRGLNGSSPMQAKLIWDMNIMGKQFPGFCPIGPTIATLDEIGGDATDVTMETWLNGQRVQHSNTSDLVWSLAEMIAYFSRWYVFRPGDVLTAGSPSGVGFGRTPPLYLRDGDLVEVRVDGIGTLANRVRAADALSAAA